MTVIKILPFFPIHLSLNMVSLLGMSKFFGSHQLTPVLKDCVVQSLVLCIVQGQFSGLPFIVLLLLITPLVSSNSASGINKRLNKIHLQNLILIILSIRTRSGLYTSWILKQNAIIYNLNNNRIKYGSEKVQFGYSWSRFTYDPFL